MATHYRTLGFIIKKTDRGETDQFLTIYTKDFGKLEILGKAIRKITSKLKAGAQLFYLSEIEFIQGKTQKTLTDAVVIEKFKNVRNNLEKLETAYKISDALDNLVKGQEQDENLWNLLKEVFDKLNNYKLEIVYYYFLWNLLSLLGYQFDLFRCSICQKKLSPRKIIFDPEEGLTDNDCYKKINSQSKLGTEILPDTIKILRLLTKQDWKTILRLNISEIQLTLLRSFSENYLSCLTNK